MEVDHQERHFIVRCELGVGEGVIDVLGGVDAPAELGALGRSAAEPRASNGLCLLCAVVRYDGLHNVIALLELLMHGVLRLVAQASDFANFEVGLLADGLRELREISDEARAERMLQDAKALLVEVGVEQRALDVIDLGVDDCAVGQFRIVVFCAHLVVDEHDGLHVEERVVEALLWILVECIVFERVEVALLVLVVETEMVALVELHVLCIRCWKVGCSEVLGQGCLAFALLPHPFDVLQRFIVHAGAGSSRHVACEWMCGGRRMRWLQWVFV